MPFNPDGSRKTMAYKKANTGTPTTFKMRSGNGALPFKQMGASPTKQLIDVEEQMKNVEATKEAMRSSQSPKSDPDPEGTKEKERIAKIDATRGTERGQVKKQGRLDKIQKRQDKRAYKKYLKKNKMSGDDATFKNWKASEDYTDKESKRETRLKKEVSMTPEEYKANQAEKKQKFQDSMNRLAMTVHPNFDPSQAAAFDESIRTRDQKEESQRISDEYKMAETERLNQANKSGAEAYAEAKAKANEMQASDSNAVDKDGEANLDSTETT